MRSVFLGERRPFVSHHHSFGFQNGGFIFFTEIRQSEEGIDQLFLPGQLAQGKAFRDTHRVDATDNHIVFLQFPIHVLHLLRRRIPADTETSDRVIAGEHLLELVAGVISDREGGNLLLVQLFQWHDISFILHKRDRLGIQLCSQPGGMGRVQASGQAFRVDGTVVVQSGDIFVLQNLDDLCFHLFPIQNTLFQRILDCSEIVDRSGRSQQDIVSGKKSHDGRVIRFAGGGAFHR